MIYYSIEDLANYLKYSSGTDVEIEGKLYKEILNASFNYDLTTLINTQFSFDHINEALSVIYGNPTERYEDYHECWIRGLPRVIGEFLIDCNTRRAIFIFQKKNNSPTCLTSIQFQLRNRVLSVTANFRSWELNEFAEYDLCLLASLIGEIRHHLYYPKLGNLTINAANAHILIGEKK